jgi:hypothetical protein
LPEKIKHQAKLAVKKDQRGSKGATLDFGQKSAGKMKKVYTPLLPS